MNITTIICDYESNTEDICAIRYEVFVEEQNVPEELEKEIMVEFCEAPCGDRSKLLNYFIQSRLKNLTNEIGEF